MFALAGASFLCDRLLALTTAVLSGLRRFDLTNSLATLAAIVRAIGIIVLIKTGSGVVAVMVWQGASTLGTAIAGQLMVRHLQPEFRLQVGRVDWDLLRTRLAFGLAIQLTSIVEIMIWDIAPLVVGLVLGSKWIVVYYIAQQFPISLGPVIWSTAEALFPAASQHRGDRGVDRMRRDSRGWHPVDCRPRSSAMHGAVDCGSQALAGVGGNGSRGRHPIPPSNNAGRVHGGVLCRVHPGIVGTERHSDTGDYSVCTVGCESGTYIVPVTSHWHCGRGVGPGSAHVRGFACLPAHRRAHVRNQCDSIDAEPHLQA